MCVCLSKCVLCMYTYAQINICTVYMCIYLQSPSNQSFYRKIAGYRMSVGDHEVA